MPEPILKILTFCLVALLYLFFFRVLRAVWAELKIAEPAKAQSATTIPAPTPQASPRPHTPPVSRKGEPIELRVLVPPALAGQRFPIAGEMTVGRAPGCAVHIDDPTVSSLHARLARSPGGTVAEDLGSRNGTWVNGRRLTGQANLNRGDRLRFGNVELEVA